MPDVRMNVHASGMHFILLNERSIQERFIREGSCERAVNMSDMSVNLLFERRIDFAFLIFGCFDVARVTSD
jgi:hypothetical protein